LNHQLVKLSGGVYFVATPIGTARDITLRALDILASADVLAAEDTRSLRRLMEIHGVPLSGRKVIAYHDHNGDSARPKLMQALADGKSVAYASEAGMPLIADPGYDLGRAATEAGYTVTCAPGASAVPTALVLSGLATDAFFFAGFLPTTQAARQAKLKSYADIQGTLVFFESPKRIERLLTDMQVVLGPDRHIALCRELTKKFEEVERGTISELLSRLDTLTTKGEFVVCVERGMVQKQNDEDIESALRDAMQTMSLKDAAAVVAHNLDLPRRDVYQLALGMERT